MESPSIDSTRDETTPGPGDQQQHEDANGTSSQPVGAAAAAQLPKVVQTAFIHKLYNMLEDQSIQHLISWSSSNESFVMSPSSEFSKVLAQYFKHGNVSSFVRQLNMYGFHKVSDVFRANSSDQLWEFKHGQGNFKRGDLVGLREIKRRASRHALTHRDSFSNVNVPKIPSNLPLGVPMEVSMQAQDPVEARLAALEWHSQDLLARLTRSEDAYTAVASKCQRLLDGLTRCHQWNQELSSHLLSLVPDPDNQMHRDVLAMRSEIYRNIEQLRMPEAPIDPLFANKPTYFHNSNHGMEPPMPMSPRQQTFDDSRRPSLQSIGRPGSFRTPTLGHMQGSPRRLGSISTGGGAHSPSARPNYLPPPPVPPLPGHIQSAQPDSPPANLTRRHTFADIRVQGWQNSQPSNNHNHTSSPYASGQSSTAWPSSPRQNAVPGDLQLRDSLALYELPRPSNTNSGQPSPPTHETGVPSFASSFGGSYANTNEAGWQIPGPRYPWKGLETPGPPTRRSSMASNVHSLLNPADTVEREDEDEGPDERKRKRGM